MALTAFPVSGTADYEVTARATLEEWRLAIEEKATATHIHSGGDPSLHKIIADESGLGTGAQDGEFAVCKNNSNRYVWEATGVKWRILPGNIYSTSPATATYYVETGTNIIIATGGIETNYKYDGASWVSDLASNAEVTAGASTAKMITPAGLQQKTASATAKGIAELATTTECETGTDTERAVTPAGAKASAIQHAPLDNYITGLVLSNDTDADHDINITIGMCRDSTNVEIVTLATNITKRIDTVWSVGNDAGGLDTGSVAAATIYAVWLIKRSDTGVVDALFSASTTAPTMPANYDYKRFIGYVWTLDGAATIKPFVMNGNGEIWFTKASQVIILNSARTAFDTYGDTGNPIDLSGDLPVGHYDSVLFGGQSTASWTKLELSNDATNTMDGVGTINTNTGDTEVDAWGAAIYGNGQSIFLPILDNQIYAKEVSGGGATNILLLIHAVKLKHR